MKALITGINGFVGPHLKAELEKNNYEVFGSDIHKRSEDAKNIFICDITNYAEVLKVINQVKPDCIFHLAGFSSVAKSFQQPELCHKINVEGTRNLLKAIVEAELRSKVLIVSSAQVYGRPKYLPIDEKHPIDQSSPYAKSRIDQENLCKEFDLPIIIARSFNHTGPGQPDTFAIPSFKKQVKETPDGGVIKAGNIEVVRDFSDVRDVVRAYRVLIEKGKEGEIYNVGSGKGLSIKEVIETFMNREKKNLKIEIDPNRTRDQEIPALICDNSKISKLGVKIRDIFSYPD